MKVEKALAEAGVPITTKYTSEKDIDILIATGHTGRKAVRTANFMYNNSDEISDEDIRQIGELAILGDEKLVEFIRSNRDKVRVICKDDLYLYTYVIYVSKRYGVAGMITAEDVRNNIGTRIEEMLSTGDFGYNEEALKQGYVAVCIDRVSYIKVSKIYNGIEVTKPCLGRNIRERVEEGKLDMHTYEERGGTIKDRHFYLLHKNHKTNEYYLTRYKALDKKYRINDKHEGIEVKNRYERW